MTPLTAALLELTALLDELHLAYMVIGGVAVGQWGEPRATLDVDLSIWVEPERFESTVEMLAARLPLRTAKPLETARRLRLLPALASNGIPVDLLFAAWPLEKQAIEQAVERQIGGKPVRIAALDYLLFLKLISDRPKDLADAGALLHRHRGKADLQWLERELSELAESSAQPEILARFQRLLLEE